jgi:hypothetical protein
MFAQSCEATRRGRLRLRAGDEIDDTLVAASNLALLHLASRPDESIRIWDELLKRIQAS